MYKQVKTIIHTLIGFLIGGIFLYFTLAGKDFNIIVGSIKQAKIFWLVFSFVLLILIFFLRSLRWHILLAENNINKSIKRVFVSVLQGYFVNSFTPKLGEIVRCTSLGLKNDKQLAKSLGSVVAERAYDLIILCMGLVLILLYEFDILKDIYSKSSVNYTYILEYKYIIILCLLLIGALGLLILRKIRSSKGNKISILINSLIDGLKQGFFIKKNKEFIFLTISIWLCLILLNYAYLQAIPGTDTLNIGFAAIILFIGGLGWALPSPGGIGTTHFIILHIFLSYSLDPKLGISFGIISNGLTFISTIFLGFCAWSYHTYNSVQKKEY